MTPGLISLLSGMLAAGYLVVAGFFFRFWRQTRDRLFVMFSIAFGILALQRVILTDEVSFVGNKLWGYSLRLIAFALIIVAIVMKNRERRA